MAENEAINYDSQWTNEAFNKRFDELIKEEDSTYETAYTKAEEEHVKLFGSIRYKNYDSFRSSRRYLLFKR